MSTNNSTSDPGAVTTPSAPLSSHGGGDATTPSNTPSASTPTTASEPTTHSTTSEPSNPTTPTTPTTPTPTSTPPTSSSSSTRAPPTTSSEPPTTSSTPPPPPTTSSTPPDSTTFVTPSDQGTSTSTFTVTQVTQAPTHTTPSHTTSSASTTSGGAAVGPTGSSGSGLSSGGKIAIAVVVPIAAVALLLLAGIYFWRKRKQRKDAEEERRKEVEDYTFNPNGDRDLAALAAGGASGANGYEMMKEDANSSGYRGWGTTTLAGSTGRKASTTMSGGAAGGPAFSDATSPTRGGPSDGRSGDVAYTDGTQSPEGEILGAMGPSAGNNRAADVRRGPSNASSSYSAAAHSDGSGDGGVGGYANAADATYYNQYGGNNPYAENPYGSPPRPTELAGAPVIRDNPARRNTRIESPAHYPQQSANVSQNF
ncbi:uncharacterized protein SPSK_01769 [Sporothrix schenckii 1099-18]|uniref:Serine-rich protein n=1 Tax=Sporothrix schenckii 1099-18 TaxID=1397361 RepID=A0A0F2MD25_SPOSC|nr:uncharacterized protein SPSK_01769 [Sporothrix schenckii 1099-18]KJR86964.1 hypothetical protein SPSK_01769 [Sporothrix schenckii 1099-18]